MKLVFAGTPDVALPALAALSVSGHELAAVITRPDAPAGRGRRLHPSPVAVWANDHGIEVLKPAKPSEPDFLDRLNAIAPDCVPVVAYGALIPETALAIPRYGWVNLHFSLLPAWRGAAPVQYAIWHGDEFTGASVFAIEKGLDTGPVYGTVTEPIRATDTSGDLLQRLSSTGATLLTHVIDGLDTGDIRAIPQSAEGVSLAPKITVDDARVDWTEPAFAVDRRIRAVTPSPRAWSMWDGQRVRLGPVTVDDSEKPLAPGQLRVGRKTVHIGTSTVPVRLGDIQPPGKKFMPADAWARGLADSTDVVFE